MADQPTVTITGLDNALIRIEGKFSSALDRRVLNIQGSFVKQMDRAASRVFEAMGKDVQIGGIVARRVMGSHANTPSFLLQEGATPWEKLTPKYEKQKKKRNGNRNYWMYTGAMIKTFRTQSERMARMSNNTLRYAAANNPQGYASRFSAKNTDPLFTPQKTIPAYGRNVGTRGKNYDFIYDAAEKAPKINYSEASKKAGAVPEKYVKQMRRTVEFNVFNGYAKFVSDMLQGTVSTSPEDYLKSVTSGTQIIKNPRTVIANPDVYFNKTTGQFERRLNLGYKLHYRRDGKLKQRDLVQPYMRYFFKRVMVPLARNTIRGMKK